MSKKQVALVIVLLCIGYMAGAQVTSRSVIELDTGLKIIGAIGALGGFYLGYTQLKTKSELSSLKLDFQKQLHDESEKLDAKISLSGKNIEAKMLTQHDMTNFRQLQLLQQEILMAKIEAIKEQLTLITKLNKNEAT